MRVRRRTRTVALAAAAVATALALAACGSSPTAEKAPGNAGLDVSHPTGGDKETEGTPTPGGTLVVGMYTEARSFDPTIGSNLIASAVYDSLLRMDAAGNPQPFLAESMTTPDQGTTWVLKLRPNVTFQDGTPFNSQAVIFNVNRQLTNPAALGHLYTEPIASMDPTDDLTVTFHLKRPVGSFPVDFALPFSSGNLGTIASPTAIQKEGANYGRNPVGAGPFQFVDWIPNNKIDVKRFPNYWQKGKPYLDAIQFRPLSDTDTRYASVVNGDIDLDIGGFFQEVQRSSADPNLRTYYGPGGDGEFFYLNMHKAPFDDPRMRQAVTMAIDPKALNATQYGNVGSLATTAFAPGDPNYSAKAADAYPKYDPDKAKQLVADYKASGGDPSVEIEEGTSAVNIQYGQFMQAQLAAVGIDATVHTDDISTLITTVVQGGQFQMVQWISGPYENPYPFMFNQFHTGGINNYGKYSNPKVDALLDDAVGTSDPAERASDYQQAQELINADLPVLWMARAAKAAIARPNVKGVERYLSSELWFADTWKSS
ncbi:ABC transporter substrate-binding protein [Pseudonocardia benzenivorans]|uniref:ABC transporter substrate-binding protein n=1 Tax=Pseudonocardia benzenivorans TaxID=228005 RepID=A0ABW3VLE6_9PSEU